MKPENVNNPDNPGISNLVWAFGRVDRGQMTTWMACQSLSRMEDFESSLAILLTKQFGAVTLVDIADSYVLCATTLAVKMFRVDFVLSDFQTGM